MIPAERVPFDYLRALPTCWSQAGKQGTAPALLASLPHTGQLCHFKNEQMSCWKSWSWASANLPASGKCWQIDDLCPQPGSTFHPASGPQEVAPGICSHLTWHWMAMPVASLFRQFVLPSLILEPGLGEFQNFLWNPGVMRRRSL